MAITKLMHMKESKGSNPSAHLQNAIDYILDSQKGHSQEKTLKGLLVAGNCGSTTNDIYQTMMNTKNLYGKNWGRQGYHFVLSFPPGEVDAVTARDITQEFCERYFEDNYDYVVAAHDDQKHKHGHIIFNSVSRTGRKYRYEKGDWEKYIQKLANTICKERGLSYISLSDKEIEPSEKVTDYKKWEQGRGVGCWRNLIRQNIDEAIEMSDSFGDMLKVLMENGYMIREGESKKYGHYISLRPEGAESAARNYTLGKGYSVEDIKRRIANKELNHTLQQKIESLDYIADELQVKYYGLKKQPAMRYFYCKTIFLCKWNNKLFHSYPQIKAWKYRKDLKELTKHVKAVDYIAKKEIQTMDEVDACINEIEDKIFLLELQKKKLIKSFYDENDVSAFEHKEKEREFVNLKQNLKKAKEEKKTLLDIKSTYRIIDKDDLDRMNPEFNGYSVKKNGVKARDLTSNKDLI
ncbi:hypothetical protein M2145_002538 [Lachnospiraceae bacterium PF1-21]